MKVTRVSMVTTCLQQLNGVVIAKMPDHKLCRVRVNASVDNVGSKTRKPRHSAGESRLKWTIDIHC